jgi:hypothetical protein
MEKIKVPNSINMELFGRWGWDFIRADMVSAKATGREPLWAEFLTLSWAFLLTVQLHEIY